MQDAPNRLNGKVRLLVQAVHHLLEPAVLRTALQPVRAVLRIVLRPVQAERAVLQLDPLKAVRTNPALVLTDADVRPFAQRLTNGHFGTFVNGEQVST